MYFFFIKYEIANALPVVDTVRYFNGTVCRRVTKNKIAPGGRVSFQSWKVGRGGVGVIP